MRLLSACGGFLTSEMYHHRETIKPINVSDKDPKFQYSDRDCDEKSAPSEVKKKLMPKLV